MWNAVIALIISASFVGVVFIIANDGQHKRKSFVECLSKADSPIEIQACHDLVRRR